MNSKELEIMVDTLWMAHKDEIIRDNDWWFKTDNYDVNFYHFHDATEIFLDDAKVKEPSRIVAYVYKLEEDGTHMCKNAVCQKIVFSTTKGESNVQ
jgi:hypothetical protein